MRLATRMNRFSCSDTLPVTKMATAAGTKVMENSTAAPERHQHGQRHRREHLALDAGQRQHGQVDNRDDQRSEQARLDDLARPAQDRAQPFGGGEQPAFLALRLGQHAQAVLDDDHGAVDDDAEIDRAQAHQVRADFVSTMPVIVMAMESGMTQATTSAARMFPRIRNSTATTSAAPSRRLFSTVRMVASTRWVRS